jgi:TolA-binding protein
MAFLKIRPYRLFVRALVHVALSMLFVFNLPAIALADSLEGVDGEAIAPSTAQAVPVVPVKPLDDAEDSGVDERRQEVLGESGDDISTQARDEVTATESVNDVSPIANPPRETPNAVSPVTDSSAGAIAPGEGGRSLPWVWIVLTIALVLSLVAWLRSKASKSFTPGPSFASSPTTSVTEANTNGKGEVDSSSSEAASDGVSLDLTNEAAPISSVLASNGGVAIHDSSAADTSEPCPTVAQEPDIAEAVPVLVSDETEEDESKDDDRGSTATDRPATDRPATETVPIVSADGRVELVGFKPQYYWSKADLIYQQGLEALAHEDAQRAIALFRRVVDLQPVFYQAWLQLGQTQLNAGHVHDALATYGQLITLKSDVAEAWLGKGHCLERLGKREEAQTCYAEAARLKTGAPLSPGMGVSPSLPGTTTEGEGEPSVSPSAVPMSAPVAGAMVQRPPGEGTVVADVARLDVVMLINRQESVGEALHQFSQVMEGAIATIAAGRSVDVRVAWLGAHGAIANSPVTESALDYLSRVSPGATAGTSPLDILTTLAQHFDWRDGSAHSLFYIGSDEDGSDEDGNNSSNNGGSTDGAVVASSIDSVKKTGTVVSTYLTQTSPSLSGHPSPAYASLVTTTGGLAFTPQATHPPFQSIMEQVLERGCRFCTYRRLTVRSQQEAYELDQAQMDRLRTTKNSVELSPGTYLIRIREGAFSDGLHQPQFDPEPWVLLWIDGGRIKNQRTNVEVGATWVVLSGYNDTLKIEVLEKTTLCALVLDTDKDDNSGQLTVSVLNTED